MKKSHLTCEDRKTVRHSFVVIGAIRVSITLPIFCCRILSRHDVLTFTPKYGTACYSCPYYNKNLGKCPRVNQRNEKNERNLVNSYSLGNDNKQLYEATMGKS